MLHVSLPRDRDSGRMVGLARGVVAVGDGAVGVVAVGGFAVGLLAIGGIGIGLVSVSGAALSIVALAGVAAAVIAITGLGAGVWIHGPRTAHVRDEPLDIALQTLVSQPVWLLSILAIAALLVAVPWLLGRTPPRS